MIYNYWYQARAINTLKLILNTIRVQDRKFIKAWELNERHYGELTGLNKDEMKKKFGEEEIFKLRRSWDYPPRPLSKNNPYHPMNIETYNDIPRDRLPDTESLRDTYNRVVKFYDATIKKNLNTNILIAAHGNSIRALCKYLFELDNDQISGLEIPTGNPLIIEFDKEMKIKSCEYLDKERSKDLLVF